MVTIHTPQMQANGDTPIMPVHTLQATTDTKTFKKGETAKCFITKMSDGRFSLMDANFLNTTVHYEVHSEESLHESFTEIG